MKVLLAHNFYQQPGGEDQAFRDEAALLESRGHTVIRYTVHNDAVAALGKVKLAAKTVWNRAAHRELSEIFEREQPAVAHFQNTFPLISPAAYYAARKHGVAVVQEVQNYRLVCPGALLVRDGKPCEDCVGKLFAWPGVKHGCYRQSSSVTAVVAGMLSFHKIIGTWNRGPDAYIAVSNFVRTKLVQGGIPAEKVFVKGNFISPDPAPGSGSGGYAVFVGRLTQDKGIPTLLKAWETVGNLLPIKILGAGPEERTVKEAAGKNPSIEALGRRSMEEVLEIVGNAAFLIFPSEWYEGQPKVILEAFARGTPVISSNMGSMTEMIEDGVNGRLFEPRNSADLADKVREAIANPAQLAQLRVGARQSYQARYTADENYEALMNIYRLAIANRGASAGSARAQPSSVGHRPLTQKD